MRSNQAQSSTGPMRPWHARKEKSQTIRKVEGRGKYICMVMAFCFFIYGICVDMFWQQNHKIRTIVCSFPMYITETNQEENIKCPNVWLWCFCFLCVCDMGDIAVVGNVNAASLYPFVLLHYTIDILSTISSPSICVLFVNMLECSNLKLS